MADYDDLPHVVIERRGSVEAFLWGALLGAGVALLLAPRSGSETQAEIRATARRLRGAAEGRVNEVRDRVGEAVERTRTRVTDRVDAVRGTLEDRAEQARHAIRAGRDAARSARSELERRVDDAKAAYRAGLDATRAPRPAAAGDVSGTAVVVTEVIVESAPDDGLA